MHLSHPFSTFYEQYICIHLWKLVSFCSKNAGFDGVWRCLTYMAPRFVSVWGSMQVLHWANSASGLGMGEKLGKHQKQSGNLRCFCFFPHKVPPKPTKTLQKEMLDHIFKGGLLRTIYDSSIKIYNLPYNIRPYFFWGGGFGGFGGGRSLALPQDVGPRWLWLRGSMVHPGLLFMHLGASYDPMGCSSLFVAGFAEVVTWCQIWWIQAIYFLEIKCFFWYHVIMFQDVLTPEL